MEIIDITKADFVKAFGKVVYNRLNKQLAFIDIPSTDIRIMLKVGFSNATLKLFTGLAENNNKRLVVYNIIG